MPWSRIKKLFFASFDLAVKWWETKRCAYFKCLDFSKYSHQCKSLKCIAKLNHSCQMLKGQRPKDNKRLVHSLNKWMETTAATPFWPCYEDQVGLLLLAVFCSSMPLSVWSLTCCSEGFPRLFILKGLTQLSLTLPDLGTKTSECSE